VRMRCSSAASERALCEGALVVLPSLGDGDLISLMDEGTDGGEQGRVAVGVVERDEIVVVMIHNGRLAIVENDSSHRHPGVVDLAHDLGVVRVRLVREEDLELAGEDLNGVR